MKPSALTASCAPARVWQATKPEAGQVVEHARERVGLRGVEGDLAGVRMVAPRLMATDTRRRSAPVVGGMGAFLSGRLIGRRPAGRS